MTKENVKEVQSTEKSKRLLSIDRFRGLCIFAMICSILLGIFDEFAPLKWLFAHYPKGGFEVLPGISIADLFAPMFIFVVGLTMVSSFNKRQAKYGTRQAYIQLGVRFLALIGIGSVINGFENGWADIFLGDAKFAELYLDVRVFAVMFWVVVALVINLIVSRFVKNEKYQKVSKDITMLTLAGCGVFSIIVILACTANVYNQVSQGHNVYDEQYKFIFTGCWDTLQNIGLAGLIALPFVSFTKGGRLTMAIILWTIMSVLVQNGGKGIISWYIEGGFLGGFSWAGILLLGSVMMELRDDKSYWVLNTLMLTVSLILMITFDFVGAKRGCTPVYAMFTTAMSGFVWGGLNTLNNWHPKFDFFAIWGSNAILTYVVNYATVNFFLDGMFSDTFSILPLWADILIAVSVLAIYTTANWYMRKKDIFVRI